MFRGKYKGAIAIEQILKLALAVLGLVLVATVVLVSPLHDAAQHGADLMGENTDYTVEIYEPQHLSDLAEFVYHRADSCDSVGSYPGLEHTYLGENPDCVGAEDSWLRGAEGISPAEHGNDMEGIFSREKFEIKERVVLNTGDPSPWLNNNLYAASQDGYEELASQQCVHDLLEAISDPITGTDSNYNMFFRPTPQDDRVNVWMGSEVDGNPYCRAITEGITEGELSSDQVTSVQDAFKDRSSQIVLCPGDKGYVQTNKGSPLNEDEYGRIAAGSSGMFPHIVITDTGDSEECGEMPDTDDYENPLSIGMTSPDHVVRDVPATFSISRTATMHENLDGWDWVSATWNINEEQECTGWTCTYTFSQTGEHTVSLTIEDGEGNSETVERSFELRSERESEDILSVETTQLDLSEVEGTEQLMYATAVSPTDNLDEEKHVFMMFYGNNQEFYGYAPVDPTRQGVVSPNANEQQIIGNTAMSNSFEPAKGDQDADSVDASDFSNYFRVELVELRSEGEPLSGYVPLQRLDEEENGVAN